MTRRPRLRKPRVALALTAAILCFGVFESAVGTGALPTASLPAYGVTNGDGSLSTVAELGDVNGDGYGDYAVGLPSSDVGGADSGIVYVFLGHAGALSGTPTAINLANASFRIVGPRGRDARLHRRRQRRERRRPGRHRHRRAHGRPAGQVRRRRRVRDLRPAEPGRRQHDVALVHRPHERPVQPGDALAARQPLRRLPAGLAHGHVAGRAARRQRRRLQRSRRRRARCRPPSSRAAAAWPCSTASRRASTSRSTTSGRTPTRTSSTSTSRRSTTRTSARASRASAT